MASKKYLFEIPDDPNHAANKVIKLISRGSDVLEVGCASGIQSRVLKENLNCRVIGLEINPLAAEDAQAYCEKLIIGNIENLDLDEEIGDRRFDVIMFIDVLEHLVNPTATLKKVLPFLKENGHLIASIPNIAHSAICWELAHGRFDYQNYGLLDNTHIRFFTKKNIVKLFVDAGYHIELWDKVTKAPEATEFNITISSSIERSFLDWINRLNPEANTYQFIVKARPALNDQEKSTYQHFEEMETLRELEITVEELKRQNRKLESQIEWLEQHRFGPLSGIIQKFIPKA
ncbi:MAG: methyltransferase domain-containing protein [Methylococcaceae bacterium]